MIFNQFDKFSVRELWVICAALDYWAWAMDLDGREEDNIDYTEGVESRALMEQAKAELISRIGEEGYKNGVVTKKGSGN